jgi:hypothetical protein
MRGAGAQVLVALAVAIAQPAAAQPAPGYEISTPDRLELVAGAPGALKVSIAVDRGLTISRDAALILDLTPDPGDAMTIKKRRLGRGDAVDPEAESPRFAVDVRADTAGDATVGVRVRFWLCTTRACRPVDVRRKVAVTVAAAGAQQ